MHIYPIVCIPIYLSVDKLKRLGPFACHSIKFMSQKDFLDASITEIIKVLVRFRPFQGHIRDPRPILPRIDTLIVENERFP